MGILMSVVGIVYVKEVGIIIGFGGRDGITDLCIYVNSTVIQDVMVWIHSGEMIDDRFHYDHVCYYGEEEDRGKWVVVPRFRKTLIILVNKDDIFQTNASLGGHLWFSFWIFAPCDTSGCIGQMFLNTIAMFMLRAIIRRIILQSGLKLQNYDKEYIIFTGRNLVWFLYFEVSTGIEVILRIWNLGSNIMGFLQVWFRILTSMAESLYFNYMAEQGMIMVRFTTLESTGTKGYGDKEVHDRSHNILVSYEEGILPKIWIQRRVRFNSIKDFVLFSLTRIAGSLHFFSLSMQGGQIESGIFDGIRNVTRTYGDVYGIIRKVRCQIRCEWGSLSARNSTVTRLKVIMTGISLNNYREAKDFIERTAEPLAFESTGIYGDFTTLESTGTKGHGDKEVQEGSHHILVSFEEGILPKIWIKKRVRSNSIKEFVLFSLTRIAGSLDFFSLSMQNRQIESGIFDGISIGIIMKEALSGNTLCRMIGVRGKKRLSVL